MSDAQVLLDGDGPVRTLTLNRPDRHNAQTPRMWAELAEAGRTLSADPDVRGVLLTGAGRVAQEYAGQLAAAPRAASAFVKAALDEPDHDRNYRIAAAGQAACIRGLERT